MKPGRTDCRNKTQIKCAWRWDAEKVVDILLFLVALTGWDRTRFAHCYMCDATCVENAKKKKEEKTTPQRLRRYILSKIRFVKYHTWLLHRIMLACISTWTVSASAVTSIWFGAKGRFCKSQLTCRVKYVLSERKKKKKRIKSKSIVNS